MALGAGELKCFLAPFFIKKFSSEVVKMANIWDHPEIIAQEALTHLESSLVIGSLCTKDVTNDFINTSNGWKVGDTVPFRTHGEYAATEFTTQIAPQEIRTSTRSLTIEKLFDISVEVTAREEVMDLDSFSDQVIKPAMYSLGEATDVYLGTKIMQAQGLYASTALFETAADIALARKAAILQQLSMNRFCLVDLDIEATLLGQTWFNQAQTRGSDGETTLRNAQMGRTMGMDFNSSISYPTNSSAFVAGSGTAVVNNGAGGNTNNKIGVSTLTIDGGSADTFKAGDRLAIAGVKRPVVVLTTTAALNTPVTTVALAHPITEIIPDNAAITVIGSGQSLTYHGAIMDDKSLAVAFPKLDLPGDKICAVASSNGISVRIVKGYDMTYKKNTLSMDFLVGAFCLDPRRITLLANY
jgi:hypothetical protein